MTIAEDRLGDYLAVVETVQRYGLAADAKDFEALRSLFTDDAEMVLPNREPLVGPEDITSFVTTYTADRDWSHHVITVAYVRFRSADSAEAFSNVTSHHTVAGMANRVGQLCGRYLDELRLVEGRWLISAKRLHVGWREEREFVQDMDHIDDRTTPKERLADGGDHA